MGITAMVLRWINLLVQPIEKTDACMKKEKSFKIGTISNK